MSASRLKIYISKDAELVETDVLITAEHQFVSSLYFLIQTDKSLDYKYNETFIYLARF
nr:hypothetical protein [Mycoplasmopsis bovis]